MTAEKETYLGDAVYASFDGYQIRLRTGDGNGQVIYLEPGVIQALAEYSRSVMGIPHFPSEHLRTTRSAEEFGTDD